MPNTQKQLTKTHNLRHTRTQLLLLLLVAHRDESVVLTWMFSGPQCSTDPLMH